MSAREYCSAAAIASLAVAVVAVGSTPGCARARRAPSSTHALVTQDFVASAGEEPAGAPEDEDVSRPVRLGAGDESLRGSGSFQDRIALQPLEVGEPVLVDSMVGQVNGRPIFADEFFEPIEDELIALSRRVDRREYVAEAGRIVSNELRQVILNALFLAEAEASLTTQEQQGIRAWLGSIREGLISGFGGSEARARQDLQQTGETVESRLADIKDRALIRKVIDERITPRVIISWRDIEREYERQREVFNPPGRVTLGRIRLRTQADATTIEDVDRRLAGGEPFRTVAIAAGAPDEGVWETYEIEGEDLVPPSITNETVRQSLAPLRQVGDTTDAFQVGGTTWWVCVLDLERPDPKSLYDPAVQRQISRYLHSVRGAEEQNKFIASMLERGIYDELDAMAERLLTIAILRYAPTS